eukprot:3633740-Rhodomonas_salina.2
MRFRRDSAELAGIRAKGYLEHQPHSRAQYRTPRSTRVGPYPRAVRAAAVPDTAAHVTGHVSGRTWSVERREFANGLILTVNTSAMLDTVMPGSGIPELSTGHRIAP